MVGPVFGQPEPGANYKDRPGAYAFIRSPEDPNLVAVMRTIYGVFLPGGGIEPGESILTGLHRELREELSCAIVSANQFAEATQFLYSKHYRQHFKKIAYFFAVTIDPDEPVQIEKEHELVWLPIAKAKEELYAEYQRWAASEFARQVFP